MMPVILTLDREYLLTNYIIIFQSPSKSLVQLCPSFSPANPWPNNIPNPWPNNIPNPWLNTRAKPSSLM
jgi:hypothetical protein